MLAQLCPHTGDKCLRGALDGAPLISKTEIPQYSFEFVIVTSGKYFWEIQREAVEMGISEDKIINGSVFKLPLFDFKKYLNLFEDPVTILSNDCWGGYMYHRLCMKFHSPLINTICQPDSYAKLIQNPAYYFSQPLKMEQEGFMREGVMPVGSLGDGEKKVKILFPHSSTYAQAELRWNRRLKRVNLNNLFLKMSFDPTEETKQDLLEAFSRVPYHKVCFYSGETDIPSVVYLKGFKRQKESMGLRTSFAQFVLDRGDMTFKEMDLLNLLNGEPDCLREI